MSPASLAGRHAARVPTVPPRSSPGSNLCPPLGLAMRACYCRAMTLTLRAQVRAGRLVLDEPTELPEGTEVELVLADEGDELDESDRALLHASLARSAEQFRAGRGIDAEEALARLRG